MKASAPWYAEAREMRSAGATVEEICRAFGYSRSEVYKVVAGFAPGSMCNVTVPGWVKSAGLEDDYRDIALEKDEFAAASHCRALKRAMGVPA